MSEDVKRAVLFILSDPREHLELRKQALAAIVSESIAERDSRDPYAPPTMPAGLSGSSMGFDFPLSSAPSTAFYPPQTVPVEPSLGDGPTLSVAIMPDGDEGSHLANASQE